MSLAFLISDNKGNIAILSKGNDNPDSWYGEENDFINLNIHDVLLSIRKENNELKYTYRVHHSSSYYIQIVDMIDDYNFNELSEKVELQSFMKKIRQSDDLTILDDEENSILFELFNQRIKIREVGKIRYKVSEIDTDIIIMM